MKDLNQINKQIKQFTEEIENMEESLIDKSCTEEERDYYFHEIGKNRDYIKALEWVKKE